MCVCRHGGDQALPGLIQAAKMFRVCVCVCVCVCRHGGNWALPGLIQAAKMFRVCVCVCVCVGMVETGHYQVCVCV